MCKDELYPWSSSDLHHVLFTDLKLYSETYSGLEYDYRGLIHVYDKIGDADGVAEYTVKLTRCVEFDISWGNVLVAGVTPEFTT